MTAERLRADRMLVELGLFESRARAQAAIRAGLVSADGRRIARTSDAIARNARIEASAPHPYVSRGGMKLEAALDAFALDPTGLACLDVGASTGGFTDVLLRRCARHVTALDVGRGQLHASLRADPRVTSLDGTDIRALSQSSHRSGRTSHPDPQLEVPEAASAAPRDEGVDGRTASAPTHAADSLLREPPGLVTVDVSFIALRLVLPAAVSVMAEGAALVALIKPQFEAGRGRIGRGGIVREPAVHEAVCAEVRTCVEGLGLTVIGLIPSPVEGGDGNREFLIGARRVR